MSWIDGLLERARWLIRGADAQAQLEAELRAHLEMETERLVASGMEADAARAAAARSFGDLGRTREAVRNERGVSLVEDGWRDLVHATRALRKRPAFAFAAIATLALGIGANTTVFSVLHGMLLRPLQFRSPEELVAVWPNQFVSLNEARFLRDNARTFSVATYAPWTLALTDMAEPTQLSGARTSANLFATLGVPAAVGRTYADGDDAVGAAPLAVIGHELWMSRFGGDSSVIGRAVHLDGSAYAIVGVMPAGFDIPGLHADVWIPLVNDAAAWYYRSGVSLVFGRLAPGATVAGATAELANLLPRMRQMLSLPATYGTGAAVADLKTALAGEYRGLLLVLFGATAAVLLLAGANMANLLLARALSRRPEMALRAALGARRSRLLRQIATEGALLSTLGAAAGLGLAAASIAGVKVLVPGTTPRLGEVTVDGTVIAVCAALAVGMAVIVGLSQVAGGLEPARTGATARTWASQSRVAHGTGGVLVVSQMALSVALAIGATLMIRTLDKLASVNPGFVADHVLTLSVQPSGGRYRDAAQVRGFYDAAVERLAAIPGVVSVGAIQHLPFSGFEWTANIEAEGQPVAEGQPKPRAGYRIANESYFETMRIPLHGGRAFTTSDGPSDPAVAVINRAMARRFWAGESALGKRFHQGDDRTWVTVVGVVDNVQHRSLAAEAGPVMYRPLRQSNTNAFMIALRTTVPPMSVAEAAKSAIWAVDPGVPVSRVATLDGMVRRSLGDRRVLAYVLGVFALIALAVGAVGVHGVINYAVSRRAREIGIRLALGASRGEVARGLIRRGMTLALAGVGIGLGAAAGLSRYLRSFVYGVATTDLATFAAVSVLLCAVAAVAIVSPVARAMRTDPATVLRDGQ